MTEPIDDYLDRFINDCIEGNYKNYYESIYKFVNEEKLRKALSILHSELNESFKVLNSRINIEYDESGTEKYVGGYFKADDSRKYLSLIEKIEDLIKKLSKTQYPISLVCYCKNIIDKSKKFVVKSGGSTIPIDFKPIQIEEFNPIFILSDSVELSSKRYTKLKPIGNGSYANVFSYLDPIYNKKFVIKRARKVLNEKELKRFKREFDTLKKLKSPYIIEVYTYNENKNEYSMEFMDDTLQNYIDKNNTTLTMPERKGIINQICKGLKYIHSKKLLHRDLSLKNILVKHYEDVNVFKISDFGLVKVPDSDLTSSQTEIKGALNDPNLINVGFDNYKIYHETYALTRICYFILTGKTNINNQKEGKIKDFWLKGTNTDIKIRFQSVDELWNYFKAIE